MSKDFQFHGTIFGDLSQSNFSTIYDAEPSCLLQLSSGDAKLLTSFLWINTEVAPESIMAHPSKGFVVYVEVLSGVVDRGFAQK